MTRPVDCQRLAELLPDLTAGVLSAAEVDLLHRHADGCPECRVLLSAARGEGFVDPTDEGADAADQIEGLVTDVMARTSGPACSGVTRHLAEGLGALDAVDRELLEGHVESCADCGELAEVLGWLPDGLAGLAEVEPRADLVTAVLARTHPELESQRALTPTWRQRWGELLSRWVLERPRGGLELAYVSTVALVILCATPLSPLPRVPAQALAVVQAAPAAVVSTATATARGPVQLVEAVDARLEARTLPRWGWLQDLRARSRAAGIHWKASRVSLGTVWSRGTQLDPDGAWSALRRAGDEFTKAWSALVSDRPGAEVPAPVPEGEGDQP